MTLKLENVLHIPEDLAGQVPCQIAPRLFTDKAFDVDLDDPDFLELSHENQQTLLEAKKEAEDVAKRACGLCPMKAACQEWSLKTYVHGVCGGLTEHERAELSGDNVPEYSAVTARGARGKIRGDLVERWTAQGMSTAQIAGYLNASPRTVERYRAAMLANGAGNVKVDDYAGEETPRSTVTNRRLENGTVVSSQNVETTANTRINFSRVTPETLAIYEALSDGAVRSREEIVNVASRHVSDKVALHAGRDLSGTRAKKIAAGRRKFVLNRIDIAARRGRIHVAKPNGTVVIWLDNDVCDSLAAWHAEESLA